MKWYALILTLMLAACSPKTAPPPQPPEVPPKAPIVSVKPAPEHEPLAEVKPIEWQELAPGVVTCSLTGRQALVFYYSPACPFCQAMKRTWADPKLSTYVVDSRWCTIRVNIEEEDFDDVMMVYGVPWIDILNIVPIESSEDGKLGFQFQRVAALTGYQEPDELLERLRFIRERTSRNMSHVQHVRVEGPDNAGR